MELDTSSTLTLESTTLNRWEEALARPPIGKRSLLAALTAAALVGWAACSGRNVLLARSLTLLIAAAAVGVARSTGGIVVDRRPTPVA